jgi:NAD(P)-dependent dehydrogenase (short-subunit alcohol dehydrogenase family)
LIGRHVSVSLVDVSDVAIEGALRAHVRALAAAAAGPFCGRPVMAPKKLAERADEIARVTPLGRAGGDYDIKGPVVFFASEASRHVSGQALAIDGGGSAIILN